MGRLIAFSWYGGKTSHLKWLLPIIDGTPHKTYVEPFGGSAAVLLNKVPSEIEVYNDSYGDVVNFFAMLRDRRDELLPLLELTPYSRGEFAAACVPAAGDSDLERARKFFVRARQVRTGLATTASPGRWAYVTRDSRRGMSQVVSRWLGAIDGLEGIAFRLKRVQLECLDAIDIISRYDTDGTLHYLDPPYLMSTRSGGEGYAHEFDEEGHRRLLGSVRSLRGKVVLSGYASELYDAALPGWHRHAADATLAPSTRQGGNPSPRQEIIWTNYELGELTWKK